MVRAVIVLVCFATLVRGIVWNLPRGLSPWAVFVAFVVAIVRAAAWRVGVY